MPQILSFIDMFPAYFYDRVNYCDKEKQQSRLGGCSTIFYVLFLLLIFVYYAIPVFEQRNPKIKKVTYTTSETKDLLYKDVGPIFF